MFPGLPPQCVVHPLTGSSSADQMVPVAMVVGSPGAWSPSLKPQEAAEVAWMEITWVPYRAGETV